MKWHAERLMLRLARWLVYRVGLNDHSLAFGAQATDAKREISELLSIYYKGQP